MKKLFLLFGPQGCGKTTFVENNNLEELTVSPDSIRRMMSQGHMCVDGDESIFLNHNMEKEVHKVVETIAKARMYNGATVVVDATNINQKTINKWNVLAHTYGYETIIIDFLQDLTKEELVRRNANRGERKVVEDVIKDFYDRALTVDFGDIRVIYPQDFHKESIVKDVDVSSYKKIVIFGDVHGCYDSMKEAITAESFQGLDDSSILWVFSGDLFDRGPHSEKVFESLRGHRDNVIIVEGNHETNMRRLLGHTNIHSYSQTKLTRDKIISLGYRAKDIKEFINRCVPLVSFTMFGQTYVVTHGGVMNSRLESLRVNGGFDLLRVQDSEFIYGSGHRDKTYRAKSSYADDVYPLLNDGSGKLVQFHGHRNSLTLNNESHVYHLESRVETGGVLSVATIEGNTVTVNYYDGSRMDDTGAEVEKVNFSPSLRQQMEGHSGIRVKDTGVEGIVSCNFTRDYFFQGNWDESGMKARGLFLQDSTIVGRGYEKFFNLEEKNGYTLREVLDTFDYPVKISHKANGFLGLIFAYKGSLHVWSKSGPTTFAEQAEKELRSYCTPRALEELTEVLANNNATLLCEFVLDNDPHIVSEEHHIFVLDVVSNTETLEFLDPIAHDISLLTHIPIAPSYMVHDSNQLQKALEDGMDSEKEGIVVRDSNNRMTKVKSDFYVEIKRNRAALNRLAAGKPLRRSLSSWLEQAMEGIDLNNYIIEDIIGANVVDIPRLVTENNLTEQYRAHVHRFYLQK